MFDDFDILENLLLFRLLSLQPFPTVVLNVTIIVYYMRCLFSVLHLNCALFFVPREFSQITKCFLNIKVC